MIHRTIDTRVHTDILYGVISNESPYTVQINQKLELPIDAFMFPEHLQEKKLITKDYKTTASSGGDVCSGSSLSEVTREYIIQPKLKKGDLLIIINLGSEWLIFDKVGNPDKSIEIKQN